ncbi:MAG TPA: S-adenosylmethionine:tRNA ribosyltransferase-isomerase, partial [Longimicrobiales bacterium]
MTTALLPELDFELPPELAAREPAEARGLTRDAVRLMVSRVGSNVITHTRFYSLPDFLRAGDVLVVNRSATISGAFPAHRAHSGEPITVHLSTSLSERTWVIELRRRTKTGTVPLLDARSGDRVRLPGNLEAVLIAPFIGRNHGISKSVRLWTVELSRSIDAIAYADVYGAPIRYDYVTRGWSLSYYQTVFSSVPGSAEMPSAGRPFTQETIAR